MENSVDKLARVLRKEPNFDVLINKIRSAEFEALHRILAENGWTWDEYTSASDKKYKVEYRGHQLNNGQTSKS